MPDKPFTHGRFAYPQVGTRTVTFAGSPVAGGRVVVTVNKTGIEYEVKSDDTLELIAQSSRLLGQFGRRF